MAAQTSQEVPKSGQVGPKSLLRAAQEEPRIAQKRPKAGQESPKSVPDLSKTESNELQDRVQAPYLWEALSDRLRERFFIVFGFVRNTHDMRKS